MKLVDLALHRASDARVPMGNPAAALHKAIVAAGYLPGGDEITFEHEGRRYVAQLAVELAGAAVVEVGDWGAVQLVEWDPGAGR